MIVCLEPVTFVHAILVFVNMFGGSRIIESRLEIITLPVQHQGSLWIARLWVVRRYRSKEPSSGCVRLPSALRSKDRKISRSSASWSSSSRDCCCYDAWVIVSVTELPPPSDACHVRRRGSQTQRRRKSCPRRGVRVVRGTTQTASEHDDGNGERRLISVCSAPIDCLVSILEFGCGLRLQNREAIGNASNLSKQLVCCFIMAIVSD
jgi:hypothetical protein